MEEILKQILSEIKELKTNQVKTDQKLEELKVNTDQKFEELRTNQAKTDQKIEALGDRINAHDKSNKEEFRQINKRLDGITEVVAKTMEDVTELKSKVEKQGIELKVLKGAM